MDVAENLAPVERIIGRVVNNKLLEIGALNSDGQLIHYERQWREIRRNDSLALLEDRLLALVISDIWCQARDAEGKFLKKEFHSRLDTALLSDDSLAIRGFSHGLDAYVIKNAGHRGKISNGMMATAVEALIGAVWIDSNHDLEAVRKVMKTLGFFDHDLLKAISCDLTPSEE